MNLSSNIRRSGRLYRCLLIILIAAAVSLAGQTVKVGDTVKTWIKTEVAGDNEPLRYRVTWIEWNSGFRNTELHIGDLVTGVNGNAFTGEDRKNNHAVGDWNEARYWEKQKASDNTPVTLTVLRSGKTLEITGKLRAERFYTNRKGQRTLGDNGPYYLDRYGSYGSWSSWYENFVKNASYILAGGWERGTFNNRKELEKHRTEKKVVDHLVQNHPGEFSKTVLYDWKQVLANLEGKACSIREQDLEYRQLGQKRKVQIKEAGAKALARFLEEFKDQQIKPFPVTDPIDGDFDAVKGKVVVLKAITPRDFIKDLDHSYAMIGSPYDGAYFIDLHTPKMRQFFDTMFRYQGLVDPNLKENYAFIGRITPEPRMLTYREKPLIGLSLEVLGASVGDNAYFIDLRKPDADDTYPFAGEDQLSAPPLPDSGNDAGPRAVIETMIHAVKWADEKLWRSLFADWHVLERKNAPPLFTPLYHVREAIHIRNWQHSRKLILDPVYDARVLHVSPVRTIFKGNPDKGIPHIREAKVLIEHIGRFDAEYRTFVNHNVRRHWTLQQLDDGPWKITDRQHL